MTPDRTDLTAELKRLRRGYGLTEQAVADSPVLLEALGNPPLKEAVNRLRNVLRGLGDHEPARVIRIAYGVEGRADLVLSARREAYKQDTGRDIKTLIRYEDKMIDELAVQLLSEQRGALFVCSWVKERRIYQACIEHQKRTFATPEDVERVLVEDGDNDPSLPGGVQPPGRRLAAAAGLARRRPHRPLHGLPRGPGARPHLAVRCARHRHEGR